MNRPSFHPELAALRRAPPSAGYRLVSRSVDLRRLYQRAATACEPGLRVVLNENVQTLDLLIADLQAHLHAGGTGSVGRGSWRGAARRHVIDWLVRAVARRDGAWIRVLANREMILLHAFEQEIALASPGLARALRRQLPRLHGIHLDMDTLVGTARY